MCSVPLSLTYLQTDDLTHRSRARQVSSTAIAPLDFCPRPLGALAFSCAALTPARAAFSASPFSPLTHERLRVEPRYVFVCNRGALTTRISIARICLVAALAHPRLAHDSSTQVAAPHNPDANPSVDGDGDRQHGRIHIAHSPCSSYSPSSTCHPKTQYPASSIPPDALPHCLSPPISDIDSRRISEAVERLSCDDHGPLCLHPRLPLQNCRHGPMFDPGVSHSLIHVSATAPYLRPYLVSTNRQMIHNPLPEPLLSDARPG